MTLAIGVVCGQCDAYSPMGTVRCASCGHDLALFKAQSPTGRAPDAPTSRGARPSRAWPPPISRDEPPSSRQAERYPALRIENTGPAEPRFITRPKAPDVRDTFPPESGGPHVEVVRREVGDGKQTPDEREQDTKGKVVSKEELMEQAKNYVCLSCSTPIPSGHKFCGRCGAAVPPDILALREEFYGSLQVPGRAKLILIRAEGDAAMEGLSFALNAHEHVVGRQGHLTFPDDRFVSPKHANLFYRDGALVVRDEGSLNGVYVRIRGSIDVHPGDMFLAGEEVFRLDATPKASDHPDPDGTYFWSSPKRPSPFRIAQILQGGATGNVVCARESGIAIGREGGDMNFPADVYMSATHCHVEADPSGARFTLTDLNSRNGTYLRMRGERVLNHGDYIFIGKKILRVEMTS